MLIILTAIFARFGIQVAMIKTIQRTEDRQGIAPVVIPIQDFHLREELRDQVNGTIADLIQDTRRRHPGLGNKISGINVVVDGDVQVTESVQVGREPIQLGLNAIPDVANRIKNAHSFDEVARLISRPPTIGGNIPNMASTQIAYGRALSHLANEYGLDICVPPMRVLYPADQETEFSQWLHAMEHGNEHWLDNLPLSELQNRISLHLPYQNRYGYPDTLMVSSSQTPSEVIQRQLQNVREHLLGYDLVAPEDYPYVWQIARLQILPSSHFMPQITSDHLQQGIYVNDQELSTILYGDATRLKLEGVFDNLGCVVPSALGQINSIAREYWGGAAMNTGTKRLATIGRRVDGSMSIFQDKDGLVLSELSLMDSTGEAMYCELLNYPHLSSINNPHKTTTGRGDTGAAAMYFDYLTDDNMQQLARQFLDGALSSAQLSTARIILSQIMTVIGSCLVHHSPHSNLGQVPPGHLSDVLEHAIKDALAISRTLTDPSEQPQSYLTSAGARGAIWRV